MWLPEMTRNPISTPSDKLSLNFCWPERSEEKLPAYRGFGTPTHFQEQVGWGTWLASIPPKSQAKARCAQRQAQGLPSTLVESEVAVPPSEASASAEEQPKAETSVAVSPVITQEPVGWTATSGSTPISVDIRDVFNLTSDEESDDDMEPPILEPVIENLGSHTSTPDFGSKSPLLVKTSPKD